MRVVDTFPMQGETVEDRLRHYEDSSVRVVERGLEPIGASDLTTRPPSLYMTNDATSHLVSTVKPRFEKPVLI
jgi:hypothetical protein